MEPSSDQQPPANTLQLHYFAGNASLAPHCLLEELGVPFELKWVDREHRAHKAPDYLKLNPNGLIPVLVDADLVLYEAAAICLHLVDSHPQARLAPTVGSAARARFYQWLVWLTNTLQATLIVYFYPERWADAGTAVAEVRARAEAKAVALLALLDAELAGHGGEWLLGETFSAVDPYALMLCRWTRGFAQQPARSWPSIGPYLQRVLARPATTRVFKREGLSAPFV